MIRKLISTVVFAMTLLLISSSASAAVRVQFKDNDGTPTSEWMRLEFKIVNDQSSPYDLANTTLSYFFRDTSQTWSTALWSFLINSNQADASTITASVASEASLPDGWVLTLKFSSGIINANSDCWVLVGVHNQIWKVNELDDYSYLPGTAFQDDDSISLYHSDERIFGPKIFSPIGNRATFTPTSNPLISYDNRKHYSSDPAVGLIPVSGGDPMLYLATSTDLYSSHSCGSILWPPNWFDTCGIDWPMDGVHLYTTSGPNVSNVPWVEQGNLLADNTIAPIFLLKDFANTGANTSSYNMFAPDIQYVPPVPGQTQGKLYMYIPMPEKADGKWQIGTASANVNSDGSYDNFIQDNNFFTLYGNFNPPASPVDPGVFPLVDGNGQPTGAYSMLYVDLTKDQADKANPKIGNISMARLRSNMTSGDFAGKVRFAYPYTSYSKLINYMEGPDVAVMRSKSGKTYYYMVFSAGDGSRLIGYAMASVAEFNADPLNCWNFKGWIFRDLSADGLSESQGWLFDVFSTGNNHANLIQIGEKYYVFYQQGSIDPGNHRRQVWAKEIALIDNAKNYSWLPSDGEIVGVSRPSSTAVVENLDLYGSLNGTTTWISRSTQYIRNSIGNDTAWSYATLSTSDTYKEGEGIYNRTLKKGSTNQEWVLEAVQETIVGSVPVPTNAVRIRNMLTPDKRMTCGGRYSSDSEGTNYGLFNNRLDPASPNQVWVKVDVEYGPPGAIMLRNLSATDSNSKFYLTRGGTTGDSDTYCKAAVSTNMQRQVWFIE